jgi:hypothetical protein
MIELAIQHFDPAYDDARLGGIALAVIDSTRNWLEKAVIGLNLCPFAKAVHARQQIRYALSDARTSESLLTDLVDELLHLDAADPAALDTTLLIHPHVLADFGDYNDFLGVADAAVAALGLEGEIQIASFHPDYRFADVPADDIGNYTNRAPYPILQLLREASVGRALAAIPDASGIVERNIATLRRLGIDGWQRLRLAKK